MKKYLLTATGVAGVTYTAANMLYGNAEYADFGFTLVSADLIQKFLPLIMGILLPLLPSKWRSLVELILGIFKPSPTKALDLINQLEIDAAKTGCSESLEACQTMREQALKRLRDEETSDS